MCLKCSIEPYIGISAKITENSLFSIRKLGIWSDFWHFLGNFCHVVAKKGGCFIMDTLKESIYSKCPLRGANAQLDPYKIPNCNSKTRIKVLLCIFSE